MRNLKRDAAVIAGSAVIAALGIGGVMNAQADPPTPSQGQQTDTSDGDGEVPDGLEAQNEADGAEADDGPNVGPDADPNEPGHQDADDADASD